MHLFQSLLSAGLSILFITQVSAQNNPVLNVKSYKLENGFTVFLNEDPTASKVFGAVMVNAGSKNESPDATGMAHYLEHLLFKGTDKLGTTDYQKEKPYLDSIVVLYDQLAATSIPEEKMAIQKSINNLAVKASAYGLPNEFDKLLKSIGGTEMNAFTSPDMTFYHNSFPAHEINKWLDIYSARFQNPIFRSFQSELEVVYEEKNRSTDNFTFRIFEKFQSMMLPGHPYGQWSTIGKTEHLKNPQLSKMYDFFHKNYVPANMALILSGNFKSEEVIPLIKQKFGVLKAEPFTPVKLPPPTPIQGVQTEYVNYTPVKVGLIGFQTVPQNHPDRAALNVCEVLLYNESETGYLNKLQTNNEIMFGGAFSIAYTDAGCSFAFFVPKIFSSYKKAETKVLGGYDFVKEGKFSDAELLSVKSNLVKTFQQELENVEDRGVMIGQAFNSGMPWEEHLAYPQKVNNTTREEVMRVAQKYFGNNYVRLISSTGSGKTPKLEKPPYKAVVAEQKGKSAYAADFEKLPSMNFTPKFIDFKKDVEQLNITGGHTMYAVKNPVNDLFYLDIRFRTGNLKNPALETATDFISYCGAGTYDLNGLKTAFAALGSTYSLSCEDNALVLHLEGKETSVAQSLELVNLILTDPKAGEKSKSILLNGLQTERKFEKSTPDFMGRALVDYAVLGKESSYLKRETASQIQAGNEAGWISIFTHAASKFSADILYTGNKNAKEISELIESKLKLTTIPQSDEIVYIEGNAVAKNTIYFVNDKKAVQSQVYFYVPGEKTGNEKYADMTAFNEYFSGGFSGLMLQEIREYRSLAYATGGRYGIAPVSGKNGRLITYIGCQADKTAEACEVMVSLIKNMPLKEERMGDMKQALQIKAGNSYPEFRELASTVVDYKRKGYNEDPNQKAFQEYNNFSSAVLNQFYQSHIQGKPYVITIYGDKSRIDLEKLKALGDVVELKTSDFIVF